METSLADIKKQYEKLRDILGDKDTLELSYEDDLRCQDALSLLKSRNYILDASTLCEKRYIKAAEWDGFEDWLNEMIKESNRMSRRECHCQCCDWRSYRPDSYDYWRIVLIYLSMQCYDRRKKSIP